MPNPLTHAGAPRAGRYSDAVRRSLTDIDGGSAQDVFSALRAGGNRVGLSTVYRELRRLSESGEVDVSRSGDETFYEIRTSSIRDRLMCLSCGNTRRIPRGAGVRHLLTEADGFFEEEHTLLIEGKCRTCP
jgi:Fur family ferric uptake transcriptional regulator